LQAHPHGLLLTRRVCLQQPPGMSHYTLDDDDEEEAVEQLNSSRPQSGPGSSMMEPAKPELSKKAESAEICAKKSVVVQKSTSRMAVAGSRSRLFSDAATMKERLKRSRQVHVYDVTEFYKQDGFCRLVAASQELEFATIVMVTLNALWIAVDADLNNGTLVLNSHPVFQVAEHLFCMYFAFEWTVRFGAFRQKRDGLRDGWFVFDTLMVLVMVGETWAISLIVLATGSISMGKDMGNASVLKLLRLLRVSRVARMAKLLRSMPQLLVLFKGLLCAMRSVLYTLVLLSAQVFFFAVVFKQLTSDTEVGRLYFRTMWTSMHTLVLHGVFMDSVGYIVHELEAERNLLMLLSFYIFVLMSALTCMNLLMCVIVEVISNVAAVEKQQVAGRVVADGLMNVVAKTGVDVRAGQQGTRISEKELHAILADPDGARLLEILEVDIIQFVDLADFIFMEEAQEGQDLSFNEFMDVVLSLRGGNAATVKDFQALRQAITETFQGLERHMKKSPRWAAASCGNSRIGLQSQQERLLWQRMAMLEGVLSATQHEVQTFADSLHQPLASSSAPGALCPVCTSMVALELKPPHEGPTAPEGVGEHAALQVQMARLGQEIFAGVSALRSVRELTCCRPAGT